MCPERRGRFEKEAGSISPLLERLEDRILLSAFSESLYALADDVDTSFTSVPTLNVELTETAINEAPSESVSAIFSEVSLDLAIDDILIEWQAAFPGQDYVVWEKDSPWDSLDQVQAPPAGVTELQSISLDIGRNEYESTSFVITNLTGGNLTFDLAHDSTQIDITLRKGIWITAQDGTKVNDALSLIDGGQVTIATGESLEIWVTLHGNDVSAGVHEQYNMLQTLIDTAPLPPGSSLILDAKNTLGYWIQMVLDNPGVELASQGKPEIIAAILSLPPICSPVMLMVMVWYPQETTPVCKPILAAQAHRPIWSVTPTVMVWFLRATTHPCRQTLVIPQRRHS